MKSLFFPSRVQTETVKGTWVVIWRIPVKPAITNIYSCNKATSVRRSSNFSRQTVPQHSALSNRSNKYVEAPPAD